MAKLVYSAIVSLDGYVADADERFDWSVPDAEVHAFVNDLERPIGTYLYGRRMYDVMSAWEHADGPGLAAPEAQDFAAIWRAAEKVVYSRRLTSVSTARTRLERSFDPAAVARMKAEARRDLSIGGPGIAGRALAAGLVDECSVFISPVTVGDGLPWLPMHLRLQLELLDERRFGNGVVYLRYRADGFLD